MKRQLFTSLLGFLTLTSNIFVISTSSFSSPAIQKPVLQIGSQGEEVSQVQAALKLLGYYNGEVSGTYNELTVIAVSRFQQAAGLSVDGIVGLETWTKLFPVVPPDTPPVTPGDVVAELPVLREGMQGENVIKLQKRLIALGFLQGAADGDFGPQTLAAVKAAQAKFNLEQDGVVGPATWRALIN